MTPQIALSLISMALSLLSLAMAIHALLWAQREHGRRKLKRQEMLRKPGYWS